MQQQEKSGIQGINSLRVAPSKAASTDYVEAASLLNSCEPLVSCASLQTASVLLSDVHLACSHFMHCVRTETNKCKKCHGNFRVLPVSVQDIDVSKDGGNCLTGIATRMHNLLRVL